MDWRQLTVNRATAELATSQTMKNRRNTNGELRYKPDTAYCKKDS